MSRLLKEAKVTRLLALVVLMIAILAAPGVVLAAGAVNKVDWGAGQPVPGKGTVSGSGTYTTAPGWSASSVVLNALPIGGGTPYTQAGPAPVGGNWGPIQINLPAGQYSVFATMIFRSAGQQPDTKVTATVIVVVQ